ncbi:MAG: trypsin-like peptidase domain-containing protein [bacterium]|nr:trypsin-like peptidase domain-containing protein [bacterium]
MSTATRPGRIVLPFFILLMLVAPLHAAKKATPPIVMGIQTMAVTTEFAADLKLSSEIKGMYILCVYAGSPAETSGLQEGDIIVRVRDRKGIDVVTPDEATFDAVRNAVPVKTPLSLTVLRAGKEMPFSVLRAAGYFDRALQSPPNAQPRTIKINPDGTGDARSLEAGLALARPGDTVLLAPGNFGNLVVWRDGLTIAALDKEKAVTVKYIGLQQARDLVIRGLAVSDTPGKTSHDMGIFIYGCENIKIDGCLALGYKYGIMMANKSSNITITNCMITMNITGVAVRGDSTAVIMRNLIIKNSQQLSLKNLYVYYDFSAAGVVVHQSQAEITNNTIIDNACPTDIFCEYVGRLNVVPGAGISLFEAKNVTIINNIIGGHNIGVLGNENSQFVVEYNAFYMNAAPGKAWGGNNSYAVGAASGNVLSGYKREETSAPLLSLASWTKVVCTPYLMFQVSQSNINSDPFFADRMKNDYRLAADSPLVNKGRNWTFIGAYPPVGGEKPAGNTANPLPANAGVLAGRGGCFVISADGYLLTCAHLVKDAVAVEIALGGKQYKATVLGTDAKHDLALLKITATGLTALPLSNSNAVELGQDVRIFSYPFTDVKNEQMKVLRGAIAGISTIETTRVFQVDVLPLAEQCGGPLVNERGEVVGLNAPLLTGMTGSDKIGLALPVNYAKGLLRDEGVSYLTPPEAGDELDGPALVKRVAPATGLLLVQYNNKR